MSLTYDIPKNTPDSAIRKYRFPYQGERKSERLNLLLQAVYGDLKHLHQVLDLAEQAAATCTGGMTLLETSVDAQRETNNVFISVEVFPTQLTFQSVSVTTTVAATQVSLEPIQLNAVVPSVTVRTTTSVVVNVDAIQLSVTFNAVVVDTSGTISVDVMALYAFFEYVTVTATQSNTSATVNVDVIALTAQFQDPAITAWTGIYEGTGTDIQAMVNATPLGTTLHVPAGTYNVSVGAEYGAAITLLSNRDYDFRDATIILNNNALESYHIIRAQNITNFDLYLGTVRGDRDGHTGTTGQWGHGLAVIGCSNFSVNNGIVEKCWGDGIYIGKYGSTQNVNGVFNTVTSRYNRRNDWTVVSLTGTSSFNNCVAVGQSGGTSPMSGLSIMPSLGALCNSFTINGFQSTGHVGVEVDFSRSAIGGDTLAIPHDIIMSDSTILGTVNSTSYGIKADGYNLIFDNCQVSSTLLNAMLIRGDHIDVLDGSYYNSGATPGILITVEGTFANSGTYIDIETSMDGGLYEYHCSTFQWIGNYNVEPTIDANFPDAVFALFVDTIYTETTLSGIQVYIDGLASAMYPNCQIKPVLYSNATGDKAGTVIAQGPEVTFAAGTAEGWVDLPFSTTQTLTVGNRYWLGVACDEKAQHLRLRKSTSGYKTVIFADVFDNGLQSPAPTTQNEQACVLSLCGVVGEAAPEENVYYGTGTDLQTMVNNTPLGYKLIVPAGTYTVTIPSSNGIGVNLLGGRNYDFSLATINLTPNSFTNYHIMACHNISDVNVWLGTMNGDRTTHTGTTGEWGHGFCFLAATNCKLIGGRINDTWGDGVYIGANIGGNTRSVDVEVDGTIVKNCSRNGLSIICALRAYVHDGYTMYNTRTDPKGGVGIEPNNSVAPATDCTVENWWSDSNGNMGFYMNGFLGAITGCRFVSCQAYRGARGLYIINATGNYITNCTAIGNSEYQILDYGGNTLSGNITSGTIPPIPNP